jgi:hypothetical protein
VADYYQGPWSWDAAHHRANRLLWSKLTEAQRSTYRRGYFDVTGSRGRRYRICTSSTVQNIKCRSIFRRWENFCVTPVVYQPAGDVLLSQKLLIESDEDLFRRVAVRSFLGWTS